MKIFINSIKDKIKYKIYEGFDRYFRMFGQGLKYGICAIIIIIAFKNLVEYSLDLAYKYNIELSGEEYVNLLKGYTPIAIGIILIALLFIPFVRLLNKLKNVSKEGASFYNDEQPDIHYTLNKPEVQIGTVKDLINSDDDKIYDEPAEEDMISKIMKSRDEQYNLIKCTNIKNNMRPLTILITRELYNNNRDNITQEIVIEHIKKTGNRKKKKMEDKNKNIAKKIIVFLKNNDIIESDDGEDEKYYFTPFGNIFMNYFQNGII